MDFTWLRLCHWKDVFKVEHGGRTGEAEVARTFGGVEVHLDGGIPTGVEDLSGMQLQDRHGEFLWGKRSRHKPQRSLGRSFRDHS